MPNRINIMTSCDNNLIKYIYVQLKTLSVSIDASKEVDFYLFYANIDEFELVNLSKYATYLGNITLKPVYRRYFWIYGAC